MGIIEARPDPSVHDSYLAAGGDNCSKLSQVVVKSFRLGT